GIVHHSPYAARTRRGKRWFCLLRYDQLLRSLLPSRQRGQYDVKSFSFCRGVLHLEVQVWELKLAGTSVGEVPLSNLPPVAPCVHARLLAACEIPPAYKFF